ncbi:MAG: DUF5011 domain-containing protein [Eggerthellaceae bacterium]|nr:DUF5011 domain-containing protein [Eggerthellaceae bacterium]
MDEFATEREQRRYRWVSAQRRRARRMAAFVAVAAVCVIGLAAGLFGVLSHETDKGTSGMALPGNALFAEPGSSFRLMGSVEQSLALNSRYVEEGTNKAEGEVRVEGTVDTARPGTYQLTYTHGSQTLTRRVQVLPGPPVVMHLKGSQHTFVREGQPYIESGCQVTDRTEGDLGATVEVQGSVDTSVPGVYEVLYRAVNSQGVQCNKVRTVEVVPAGEFVAEEGGIPVLMYHYVYTAGGYPVDDPYVSNYILDTDLEGHLQHLVDRGSYYPSYQELAAYVEGLIDLPKNSIVLTFDDGEPGFLASGIPLLEKYQVPATSFIIASDADAQDKVRDYASEYITFQSHSYAMHQGGGSVGHGGIISALSADEIVEDLQRAQSVLGSSEAFAYPFGDHTETAHEAVRRAGILCGFTTEYGAVQRGDDAARLPRVRVNGDVGLNAFIAAIS